DVGTRVAWAVLRQARESGALHRGGSFRLTRTQEELAAELGTSREGVSRALRRLRKAGVIAQRGPQIQILDPASLERLAGRDGQPNGRRDREPAGVAVSTHSRNSTHCCA